MSRLFARWKGNILQNFSISELRVNFSFQLQWKQFKLLSSNRCRSVSLCAEHFCANFYSITYPPLICLYTFQSAECGRIQKKTLSYCDTKIVFSKCICSPPLNDARYLSMFIYSNVGKLVLPICRKCNIFLAQRERLYQFTKLNEDIMLFNLERRNG